MWHILSMHHSKHLIINNVSFIIYTVCTAVNQHSLQDISRNINVFRFLKFSDSPQFLDQDISSCVWCTHAFLNFTGSVRVHKYKVISTELQKLQTILVDSMSLLVWKRLDFYHIWRLVAAYVLGEVNTHWVEVMKKPGKTLKKANHVQTGTQTLECMHTHRQTTI